MSQFETNIKNIYGDQGRAWLKELPNLVEEIASKWDLSSLHPLENLSYNYVLSGKQQSRPIILKLSLDISGLHILKNKPVQKSPRAWTGLFFNAPLVLKYLTRQKSVFMDQHIYIGLVTYSQSKSL
jgi:hypothetical protein